VAATRVSKSTKDEDDRLKKELQRADIESFKKIIKRAFAKSSSKRRS